MGHINNKKQGIRSTSHTNFMGGKNYEVSDALQKLWIMAASSFFGEPTYYGATKKYRELPRRVKETDYLSTMFGAPMADWAGLTPAKAMEAAIDAALDQDLEGTLVLAAALRGTHNMRVTPQVILVRAANRFKGTTLIREYGKVIVLRGDEPSTGLAYQLATFGKPIPNSLKRVWKDKLEGLTDYSLAKYRMESRQVKTIDVVRLTHANSPPIDQLVRGDLKNTETWEAIISERGSGPSAWEQAVEKMGHMALLRNLRNISQKATPFTMVRALDRLKATAESGKQMPFRYYAAFKSLVEAGAAPKTLDVVEECLEISIGNLPRFKGRVASLVDNSGSAQGATTSSLGTVKVAEIGNLMGVLTGKVSDEGFIGVFGDRLEMIPVRKNSSTFDVVGQAQVAAASIGMETENGIWLFFEDAIKNRVHWDTIFIYSDMQAGRGGLYGILKNEYPRFPGLGTRNIYIDIPALVQQYRREVNPNVNIFSVQIGGYGDNVTTEVFNRTSLLGGWSDSVLRYAHQMIDIWDNGGVPTQ